VAVRLQGGAVPVAEPRFPLWVGASARTEFVAAISLVVTMCMEGGFLDLLGLLGLFGSRLFVLMRFLGAELGGEFQRSTAVCFMVLRRSFSLGSLGSSSSSPTPQVVLSRNVLQHVQNWLVVHWLGVSAGVVRW
jgi:hypothetical protein